MKPAAYPKREEVLSVKRKMIFLLTALMLFAAGITACKSSDEPGGQDIDIKQEAGAFPPAGKVFTVRAFLLPEYLPHPIAAFMC